jgi:hypothetical protein
MNLIRITNVEYTTEPHITYTPCYTQYFVGGFGQNLISEYLYIKIKL